MPSPMDRADFVFGLALVAVSVTMLTGAIRMPWSSTNWSPLSAPGLTPTILSSLLLLLSGSLTLRAFNRNGWFLRPDGGWMATLRAWHADRFALALGLCAVYTLLLGRMPYTVATALYVAAFAWVFRGGGVWRVAVAGVLTAIGVTVVFSRLFLVPLP